MAERPKMKYSLQQMIFVSGMLGVGLYVLWRLSSWDISISLLYVGACGVIALLMAVPRLVMSALSKSIRRGELNDEKEAEGDRSDLPR